MPNADTFRIPPIAEFVSRYARGVIVDPFARNSRIGTITNDLNPETTAQCHLEARVFLRLLIEQGCKADTVILDPPYSPRQISEVYQAIGRPCTTADTQNSVLTSRCRRMLGEILRPGGMALSFGWNSCSWGDDFVMREILLVAHGGDHNDTICTASQKMQTRLEFSDA